MTTLRAGAATDVGKVRRNNQDNFLVDEPLFAVADGMGGAAGGEEASQTAVAALKSAFEAHPTAAGLADGVRNANRAVWEKARLRPDLRGMGTTMTAVALVEHGDEGEVLAIANVGDSRVYLLRDGELSQVTDDHSVPEELRRAGRLTPEEAARHPQRNVLTRALGIEPEVEVDCFPIIPYRGDRLVLASDGLFNEVDHDGIASVARRQRDPEAAAAELVRMARDGGGSDNITVVVVDVLDDGERAEKASAAVAASPAGTSRAAPATAATAGAAAATGPGPPPAGGGTGAASNKVAGPGTAPGAPAVVAGDWALRDRHAGRRPDAAEPFRATPPPAGGDAGGRRFTLRLAVFLLALVLVLAAAVAAVGFFARAGYYVGLDGEEVVIYKGRPGGLLWFSPTVEERTGVQLDDVRPSREQDLRHGKEEPSLAAARRYVDNLEDEAAPPTTTTTTAPVAPPAPAPTAPTPAP
ncbi:MAG: Stp1/IreP family PP2C-type Ser/Thr phosphatase [Actinomycetota bacterium]